MNPNRLQHFAIVAKEAQKVRARMETFKPTSLSLSELNTALSSGREIYFKDPDGDSSFLPDLGYALFIEDDIPNIGQLLLAAQESGVLEAAVACKDPESVRWFLAQTQKSPLFITLDFKLTVEGQYLETAIELYRMIRSKWPDPPLMGVTNYEGGADPQAEGVQRVIRESGDSVYSKNTIWAALPNIFRDKYFIGHLTEQKNSLQQKVNEVQTENEVLHQQIGFKMLDRRESEWFKTLDQKIIGSSVKMREIRFHIELAAKHNDNILILGETGSGKELVAKAIHTISGKGGQLVIVNCAALPETIIESELFGVIKEYPGFHNKTDKVGFIEQANGGTLFLDEIHHMSVSAQAKLLRMIDDKSYTRLGDSETRRLHPLTRIIAACKPDVEKLIEEGKFLEDLFGRLNSFMPEIPPLRERKEDILELLDHFSEKMEPVLTYTEGAKKLLQAQEWRRNVRELRNFIYGVHHLFSGIDAKKKNLGELPKKHLIDVDQINYALKLHNKKKAPEKLIEKILPLNQDNGAAAVLQKKEEEAAERFLGALLTAIEHYPGQEKVLLRKIAEVIVMPGGGEDVTEVYVSQQFGEYKSHYKHLMAKAPFAGKFETAIRYGPLRKELMRK